MRIALSGSAGTGKTTLARALSAACGLPLIPEEMRERLEAGALPLSALPPAEGLRVLEHLWAERLALEARLGAFVADNGALDFAAYALHHGCVGDRGHPFVRTCLAHAPHYDATLLLPWGALPYERDGVRCDDPEQERRFQVCLDGLLPQVPEIRLHALPRALTARYERLAWAKAKITDRQGQVVVPGQP